METIVASEKSTHECPILEFDYAKATKLENADKLAVMKIGDSDYNYVLNIEDWHGYRGKVAWVPPDSLVPTNKPEFCFLINEGKYGEDSVKGNGSYAKIKGKKIRGVVSYGLLVKIPEEVTDAVSYLGVLHFDPPLTNQSGKPGAPMGGDNVASPPGVYPKYDVDAFLKYGRKVFVEGEDVIITEKIHGANARYVAIDNKNLPESHENFGKPGTTMYVGSRTGFKKEFSEPPKLSLEDLKLRMGEEKAVEVYNKAVNGYKPKKNLWWVALDNTPGVRQFCEANPGYALYGEVFGQVQNLKYGAKNNEVWFRAFDILKPDGSWMDSGDFILKCHEFNVPTVPVLAITKYNFEHVSEYCLGNTTVNNAGHIREGCVVKPVRERWDHRLGRVCLKIINPSYMEL